MPKHTAAKRQANKDKAEAKAKAEKKKKQKEKLASGALRKQRDIRKPTKGKPGNGKATFT